MAPKKGPKKKAPRRSKYRNTGILGLPHTEYHSSEDEDFVPPQRATPAKASPLPNAAAGPSRRRRPAGADLAADHPIMQKENGDASSSDSDETLMQRLQRLTGGEGKPAATEPAGVAGARSSKASHAPGKSTKAALGGTADWGRLPPDVLGQVFERVCRRNAVPLAACLPCVCRAWRDVAAQLPQLWARVELGVLPAVKQRRVAAVEAGLLHMATSGRWCQVGGATGGRDLEGSGSKSRSSSPDHGRLLTAVSQHCSSSLVSLHIDSISSWHADSFEPPLLALTGLQELRLTAVTLKPATGLDRVLKALIAAVTAAECGAAAGPRLRTLAVVKCQNLNRAGVRALCPAPLELDAPASPSNINGAMLLDANGAAVPAAGAGAAGAAAAALEGATMAPFAGRIGPALASLRTLDLSFSSQILVQLHIEHLQEAAPGLEELRLNGLGGGYGWAAAGAPRRASGAPAPAFPSLRVLDVAAPVVVTGMTQHGSAPSCVGDALLARLAGGSPLLQELDISGTAVSKAGLAALPSPPLSRLQVSRCGGVASDEGLAEVARLFGGTLRELEAQSAGSRIGDAALASLGQCHQLELLDISGSGVTDVGLKALLRSLAGASLVLLELESCRGLDREVRRAAAAGLPQLRQLMLQ